MLCAGGVFRLAQAWAARALPSPESVELGLAARRIAHGAGFPLLGAAPDRLGSLETALGGMLFTAFGESGFALGLATALFGFAAIWALWRWARAALGEWGGLLALLAVLSGPPGYSALQAVPLGGWMAAVAMECLVLAQAARMADDIRDRWEPSASAYAGLGLLAGLGLWASRLTAPAVLVAAWVLGRAMNGRWKKHWKGALAAIAGMLPGIAAWSWGLFQAGGGNRTTADCPAPASWMAGLLRYGGGNAFVLLLLLAAAGLALSVAVARRRHRGGHHEHNPPRSAAAVLAVLYPIWLVSAVGGATVGGGRAWCLWTPPLAILSAAACTLPRTCRIRLAATVLFLALAAWQAVLGLRDLAVHASESARLLAVWRDVDAALEERGATALFAPSGDGALNFHLRERVAVSDGSPACPTAILRKAEIDPAPVWSGDFPGLADWLRSADVHPGAFEVAGRTFFANPLAPVHDLREWGKPPHVPGAGKPAPLAMLADGRLDTWLEGRGGTLSLEWTLPGRTVPALLRLLFDDRGAPGQFAVPGSVRIELLRNGSWEPVGPQPMPILETSLGRPYPPSALRFRDISLPSPLLPADALRATLSNAPGTSSGMLPWRLAEASLFTAPPGPPADLSPTLLGPATLGDLRARFAALPPDTPVFAPRRLSGLLASAPAGAYPPGRLPGIPDSGAPSPTGLVPDDRPVILCVETRLADAARIALGAADRPAETGECGPWTLFLLAPPDLDKRLPGTLLRWAGDLPVADQDFREVDRITDIILGKLQGRKTRQNEWLKAQYEDNPASADASDGTAQALSAPRWREETAPVAPEAPPATVAPDAMAPGFSPLDPVEERKTLGFVRQLSIVRPESLAVLPEEIVYKAGGSDLLDLRTRVGIRPAHPLETIFRDGLVLQGIDAAPSDALPGSRVELTLYWQHSGAPRTGPETTVLQLCSPDGLPVASVEWSGPANAAGYSDFAIPLRECQTETVVLDLPENLPPGPLDIQIGRCRAGLPLPVKSSRGSVLPDATAAVLDGLLRVLPAP